MNVSLQVLKVHLSTHSEVYGRTPGEVTGDKVNKNLLFDSHLQHLYITTEKKVKPFTRRFIPFLSPAAPCRHMRKVICLRLLFHFTTDLMSLSFLRPIICSTVGRTATHPSALPHRSQPLIRPLFVFLSASLHLCFSFVLSSSSRRVSRRLCGRAEVKLMLSIQR